nr:MAG TPA: hypothetical protein [Caudoviricetes sp.]
MYLDSVWSHYRRHLSRKDRVSGPFLFDKRKNKCYNILILLI